MWADRCPRPCLWSVLVAVLSLMIPFRPASGQGADPLTSGFEARDCLVQERAALVERLDGLRAEHVAELERRGYRRAWRQLRRPLREASAEGRALVEAWLDSPARARRLFLCEDELPLARDGVVAEDFADLAVDLLAGRWWADEGRLAGADRDREGAASDLDGARRQLVSRFDAMFDNREPLVLAARADLLVRLDCFEQEHVEPWHLGLDAQGTEVHFEPDPVELGLDVNGAHFEQAMQTVPILGQFVAWFESLRPGPPDMSPPKPYEDLDYEPGVRVPLFADGGLRLGNAAAEGSPIPTLGTPPGTAAGISGTIPDPRDVVEAMRIEEGWARQRRGLRREIRQEERRLAALESELERSSVHGVELDRLARDVERSRRRLGRLSEDTRRKMIEVQETEASRPWVTDMLRGRSKRTAVEGLGRADRRAVSSSEEAREVVERTVGRGATMPGTGLGGGGAYDGPPRPSGGTAVAAGAPGDGPGHGTTPDSEATGVSEEGLPALEGALTWEGPLPPPRSGWDSGLVGEVRAAHPELDDVDVRILLGLIGRALGPDSGEVAVAGLVRSLLQQNGRLALRGGEGQLSELYRPGLLEEEQVEVVFVLVVEER